MCRHLGYLGPAVSLSDLLVRPRHSLLEQTWAPRDMRGGGTVNADGFGVGWYPPADLGANPRPVRYRVGIPMWSDTSFAGVAEQLRTGAVIAAVRSATAGMPLGATNCAPWSAGRWLFSHNGLVPGWPDSLAGLASEVDVVDLMTLEAPTDSAVLWAVLRERLAVTDPVTAVRGLVLDVITASPKARMNLLLTDGTMLIATTWTHSLWVRSLPESVTLASEPFGTEADWKEIPDRRLLVADVGGIRIEELERGDSTGER